MGPRFGSPREPRPPCSHRETRCHISVRRPCLTSMHRTFIATGGAGGSSSSGSGRLRTWTRTLVIVLGLLTGTLGMWAGFAPESFYRDGPLPFVDTGWVSALPPYNEHLVRDYGFVNLGMTVVSVVAAIELTPVLVRASAGALFVFGAPHTAFHSFHLDHLSAADAATLTITTSVLTLVLPAIVFLMAAGLGDAKTSAHPQQRAPHRSAFEPKPQREMNP